MQPCGIFKSVACTFHINVLLMLLRALVCFRRSLGLKQWVGWQWTQSSNMHYYILDALVLM